LEPSSVVSVGVVEAGGWVDSAAAGARFTSFPVGAMTYHALKSACPFSSPAFLSGA
jgi:hypothetical protein